MEEGCPFFDTKPENVPKNLLGAIETAEEMRVLKRLELLPSLDKMTAYEFECYKAAEFAHDTIEAEEMEKAMEGTNNNPPQQEKFGSGDSPFKDW